MTVSVTLIVVPVVEQPDSTAARVLLVEDDVAIADLIQLYLDEEGLESTAVASAEQAEAELRRVVFHLLILDLNLPGRDGFQFLEQFRTRQSTPVIIVSARDSDEDKVLGLGVGADDFVTKPFSPRVLVARVRASLRYLQRHPAPSVRAVRFGDYTIHLDEYALTRHGSRVTLAPREFDLLAHLVCNAGRAFSPQELYASLWGNRYGDLSTVTVHIQRLRKKLHGNGAPPSSDRAPRRLPRQPRRGHLRRVQISTKLALLVVSVVLVPVGVMGLLSYLDSRTLSASEEARFAAFRAVRTWLATELVPNWEQVRVLSPPQGYRVVVVDGSSSALVSSIEGVAGGAQVDSQTLAARFPAPEHRLLEFPIFVDGTLVGAAFEIQARPSPQWLRWRWLLDSGRYGLASLVVIGALMVWWLAHALRRPLADLEHASKRIAAGDLEFRLQAKGRDEVAAVARSFDQMRQALIEERRKLSAERQRRRSFLMAMSHDLRTPLTSIKGYLEALHDGIARDRAAELRYLRIARDRVDLLETRIADLNSLLRMETGAWKLHREPRHLEATLTEMAADYREDACCSVGNTTPPLSCLPTSWWMRIGVCSPGSPTT